MKPFVLEDISIFQMQIFIAAGNTLNYTHTAQLCNTTQPTVSRQLTAMEKTLGLILFYKNGRSFQLTPAGKYLHKRFQKHLEQLTDDIQYAHELQKGYDALFTISIPAEVDSVTYFAPMSRAFSKRPENQKIRLKYRLERPDEALIHLLSHEVDIAFMYHHHEDQLREQPLLEYVPVLIVPLVAIMLRTNPLSSKKSLSIEDLRSQRFHLPTQSDFPVYYQNVLSYFIKQGFYPRAASYSDSIWESLMNLTQEDEVLVATLLTTPKNDLGFSTIDIEGTEEGLLLAWHKDSNTIPQIKRYIEFSKYYFKRYTI